MTPNNKKIIVVLGMHRSGTSALTRGLQALGADLGENLMQPVAENNEKGFWEDLDIYHFNEALLAKAGSDWHKLKRLDKSAFSGPAFSAERREAVALLSRKLDECEVFAFKDPRTALLLPLWQCVFEDLGLDDRYVIAVRNPLETAASLHARDGFPMPKGVFLWGKHIVEAMRLTEGKPRIFVGFDQLLDDPVHQLQRIALGFDLPQPDPEGEVVRAYRDEFLNKDLRHNFVGTKELMRSGLAPEYVIELHQILSDFANADADTKTELDAERWRSIEARYDEAAPLFDYADLVDESRLDAEAKFHAAEVKLKETGSALAEANIKKQTVIEAQDRISGELENTQVELDKIRMSNAAEIGLLTEAREKAETQLRDLRDALKRQAAENAVHIKKDAESIKGLTNERDHLHTVTDELSSRLEISKNDLGAAYEEIASMPGRLSSVEAERRKFERKATERAGQLGRFQAEKKSYAQERWELDKDLLLTRAQINAMRRSMSWRLTAPLRAAGIIARDPIKGTRAVIGRVTRTIWRRLPMQPEMRGRLAGGLFAAAPFLFFWSAPYKAWKSEQQKKKQLRPS